MMIQLFDNQINVHTVTIRATAEIVAVFLIRERSVVVRTKTAKWLKFTIDIE